MTDLLSSVFSISTHTSICVNHRVSEDGVVGYGGLWWVDGLVLKPGGGGKVEASGSSLACSTVTLR